jgi:beta-lactamase class A
VIPLKSRLESLCRDFNGRVGYIISSEDGLLDIKADENTVFPSASIIKLAILWTAFKKASDGQIALSETLTVRNDDLVGGYGVLQGLCTGLALTVEDLCVLMTDYSDNVATNMLISRLGFDEINEEIAACGLNSTVLARKMMDTAAAERGLDNKTSPADVVKLLRMYQFSDRIGDGLRARMRDILLKQFCNNFLSHYMPEGFRFAHKTGDLPGTLHDVGILYTPGGKKCFVAVMCDRMPDNVAGIRFLNDIGRAIFDNLR